MAGLPAQAGQRVAWLRRVAPSSTTAKAAAILVVAAAFWCLAAKAAQAGAWPTDAGRTLAIAKYERTTADQGYDRDGSLSSIGPRRDETLLLFVEHGLTPRLTLQGKFGATRGHDRWVSYSGRGPVEVGARWTVRRGPRSSLAVYLGAGEAGAGRNAGYAAPGQGSLDLECRLLYGRSAIWRGREVFVDFEAARLRREGLANETRVDAALGFRPTRSWLLLAQTYAGEADRGGADARWVKSEVSVVRTMGDWSLQVGWRDTVAGRETARDRGAVLATWRRF